MKKQSLIYLILLSVLLFLGACKTEYEIGDEFENALENHATGENPDEINRPPIIDAGPDQIIPGIDNSLSDSSTISPTFIPDVKGNYEIQLLISDSTFSDTDIIAITVSNTSPIADAGPDQIISEIGNLVTLDGSASSDTDGDSLTYSWTITAKPVGSIADLIGASTVSPTFMPDVNGNYAIRLLVSDSTVSNTDTVTIAVSNTSPIADAGDDQNITNSGTIIILDGSGSSDDDGDFLTYSWEIISKPVDSTADFSDSSALSPTFIPDYAGVYIIELVVNDGTFNSSGDTCTVTVQKNAPVVEIISPSDHSVFSGVSTIIFEGTGTDIEDGTLSGASLVWASDIDGTKGYGEIISTELSAIAMHTITLTAIDSSGATNSDFIKVFYGNLIPDTGQTQSYTDTWGEDSDYTINPPSYTDNENGTVTDNMTGLMWQQEVNGTTYTWVGSGTYCENLSLGGHTDWYLPSRRELISIVDYGTHNPSIDTISFPNTYIYPSPSYWSSTTQASDTSRAWVVRFSWGNVYGYIKTGSSNIRCVRAGHESSLSDFTDNDYGTVTDNVTGLMWQQEDNDTTYTWENALTYCEDILSLAGYSDWRLPNIKELESIIDGSLYDPVIDSTYFSYTKSSSYWSSTTFVDMSYPAAWYVNFKEGKVHGIDESSSGYVRCVRAGQ